MIKNKSNPFKLKIENEVVKDSIIRDIKTLFEQQEEDYYKPVRIDNFLRDMIINLQKFNTWKIHLTITINFMFSKNIYEEHVMHSKSDYRIYALW